jgi:Tol biopolymer transport system component
MNKSKTLFRFSFTVLLLSCLVSSAPQAVPQAHALSGVGNSIGLSPYWNFKTIETEHFRITFPEELGSTAQKVANYYEEAHSILSQELYWEASYKVSVLVIDNVDSENGMTSPTLRFGMVLFVTPPDNWESINYYDNWLRELCLHEYTHFLNMDATRGFWNALRYVVGDFLLPNSLWPSWMLEGLAVYNETRYTLAGRGRSPFYDMILRSAVSENVLTSRRFISLDKVNGPNPWYPDGETAYLFGYELMNQAVHNAKPGITPDGGSLLKSDQDALGVMSLRSSRRFPFFINGNLENITGKNWYKTWDDFIQASKTNAGEQLEKIRSQRVTIYMRLTKDGYNLYGPKLSPAGDWIAYTQQGLDDISGLYLMNRKTRETTRLLDKDAGVSVAFTKDSHFIFESRLHRIKDYYLYSDIEVLNLDDGSTHWFTSGLRARDPSLSPDNDWIAFTQTRDTTTSLVLGKVNLTDSGYSLGPTRVLFKGEKYDRVSTPAFSPDGTRVAFSMHHNGSLGENILIVDLKKNIVNPAVADKNINRYPTWDEDGHLYFVSDRTGVDNLYRYRPGQKQSDPADLVSNFETGVAFPSFSKHLGNDHYLATVFSTRGWDLAEVELPSKSYDVASLTVKPLDGPPSDSRSEDHSEDKTYPIKDYSIFPSIWPRAWAPILATTGVGIYAGGLVEGFDQVDRNRYLVTGAYDTFIKKGDLYAVYDNRYLGPTLEASAQLYTSSEYVFNNTLLQYGRTQTYSLSGYYTFQNTYSTLTPDIAYNMSRETDYQPNPQSGSDVIVNQTQLVPNVNGSITYSDVESSPLAVVPERGRTAFIGERLYMNSGENNYKGLAADYENIELGTSHVVLAPTLKGSWVSHFSNYAPSDVLVQGRQSNQTLNGLAGDNFDHLLIRGYPLQAFYTHAAVVASADLNFPIWRVFAGPGTDPIFLQNLYGFVFGETTYFPAKDINIRTLPSSGGGVHLGVDITQNVPIDLSVQYHRGFRVQDGGTGEVFFQLGLSAALGPVSGHTAK